jgi:hypothetical protein
MYLERELLAGNALDLYQRNFAVPLADFLVISLASQCPDANDKPNNNKNRKNHV